jgi:alpha-ketoglutarate-dependent dioxygenase alkB family protein 2
MCLFIARQLTGQNYNFVLLNFYAGPKDSLGMHSDDQRDLAPGSSIGSMTVGAARPFVFEPRGGSGMGGKRVAINLADGSFCEMAGLTQEATKHGIPECNILGERINMTFRNVVPGFKYVG